jgi:hypothetical protein
LQPEPTIREFRIVRSEGGRRVNREIEHYSLESILAVGYRVRSPRGTQFRQWATARLKDGPAEQSQGTEPSPAETKTAREDLITGHRTTQVYPDYRRLPVSEGHVGHHTLTDVRHPGVSGGSPLGGL